MIKNIIVLGFMVGYLYTSTFDIFMNQIFRIPTPLLFGFPLIFLFGKLRKVSFLFGREFLFIGLSLFLYYYFGQDNQKHFIVNLVVIYTCGLYFNYFVGDNRKRFHQSLFLFFILLTVSSAVMMLNHRDPSVDNLRTALMGGPISQSPTGIAASIFNFGYQLAALTAFIFIFSLKFHWNRILQLAILAICLVLIYYGLQRSVLLTFTVSVTLFMIFYYRSKAIFIFGVLAFLAVMAINFVNWQDLTSSQYDNIFAKNERKKGEDRSNLITENLDIYAQYPFGLIFYGKNWNDVSRNSHIFVNGLTSHNAYLMFFTYLGPFVGLGLLIMIYSRISKVIKEAILNIKSREYALMISLVFAFISVSLNSLFHNGWLINSNGPTVFLYFAILQLHHMNKVEKTRVHTSIRAIKPVKKAKRLPVYS